MCGIVHLRLLLDLQARCWCPVVDGCFILLLLILVMLQMARYFLHFGEALITIQPVFLFVYGLLLALLRLLLGVFHLHKLLSSQVSLLVSL